MSYMPEGQLPPDQRPEDRLSQHDLDAAAARTSLPGIFLFIMGLINALWGGYILFEGVRFHLAGNDAKQAMRQAKDDVRIKFQEAEEKQQGSPEEKKQAKEAMDTYMRFIEGFIDFIVDNGMVAYLIMGLPFLIPGLIMMYGGLRMRGLKSRGMAIFGSLLGLVPCLTVTTCPGVLGFIVAIWCLVVLMNGRVTAAFRAQARAAAY